MNSDNCISFLRGKLQFIRSVSDPTNADLFELVSFLADSNENEMICASVYPVLQRAGQPAVDVLLQVYSVLPPDELFQIRFSYAFSQIPFSPASVFESFLKSDIPRVRQNSVLGFALQNDRKFDASLFNVLKNDTDPQTAYEAAAALSGGGADVLPYFELIMAEDIREKTYMPSPTKINEDNAAVSDSPAVFGPPAVSPHSLDAHMIVKIIEIAGDIGNFGTLPYLAAYSAHSDERISKAAAASIQKINSK
ncbi:MAG: hypothetical protein LBU81_04940 [Methanosarcinales archaeon]|jgi:hypothetical protein|nr:hypothetical protein [Methanosarcinales archaeon]